MQLRFALMSLTLLLTTAFPAVANTVSQAGDSVTASLSGNVGGTAVSGLDATAKIVVQSFTTNTSAGTTSIVLSIDLGNAADSAIWQSARLSAFGFDTSATITSASTSGLYANAVVGGKLPNGFGAIGVCVVDNRNNCSGGGNGGISLGDQGVAQLTLTFDRVLTSLDLTNLGARWQSLDSARLGIRGGSGTGGISRAIPEPSAALVFGIGTLLVGAARRR